MIKYIKHNLALKLDSIGFIASTLCAIHCAAMPFIIVFLSLMGMQFIANSVVEYFFITISLIIGSFTFKHGYFNHHKKMYPFAIFLIGFVVILVGHFFFHNNHHETMLSLDEQRKNEILFLMIAPFGAVTIALSHLVNRNLSKNPKTCCDDKSKNIQQSDITIVKSDIIN